MNTKLSLLTGAILGCTISIASAEPITLTAGQMDEVTAGRGFNSFTQIQKLVDIQELIQEQKIAFFQVVTQVVGFSAVAEAEADSENRFGVDAQTFTFAEVFPTTNGFWKAASLSKSIALASPGNTVSVSTPTQQP